MTEQKNVSMEMSLAFAEGERKRLLMLREERGDDFWAKAVGNCIVTALTNIRFQDNPEMASVAETAKKILTAITPQLLELHNHPEFGRGMAAGVIEELASRRYIPLDVNLLIEQRWDREKKAKSSIV